MFFGIYWQIIYNNINMKKYYLVSIYFVVLFVIIFAMMGVGMVLLYPLKYRDTIQLNASKYNLDASLVASVINVESGFNTHSVSDVGAMGLMQLMPSTAIEIANNLGYTNFSIDQLFEPEINIEFGCYYLRYLNTKYNGNLTTVLASYNAGYSNVNIWLINAEYSQDGQTLTTTPYKETNNFIARVNDSIKIYERRFSN